MIGRMAWRNLWRNQRRTLITAAALALAVASMSFLLAMMDGMFARMVHTATAARSGEAQLHAPNYRETRDETLTIREAEATLQRARKAPGVVAASGRIWGLGLAAIGDRSRSVQLVGVDPEHEQRITNWQERLVAGHYLGQRDDEVLIGHELAAALEVGVGSKLVLTASDVRTGEAAADLMYVAGVLRTGDQLIDEQAVILPLRRAQRLTGLGGELHEVALDVDAPVEERAAIEAVIGPLAVAGAVEPVPWHELNPVVAQSLEMQGVWMGVLILFVFVILGFGIVNTIAMSLAERMHEFGVMRALGTAPSMLGALIVVEASLLGLVGAVPGALAGLAISAWSQRVGLDFSGSSQMGMTLHEPIYPVPDVPGTLLVAVVFSGLTAITSIVSAIRAARVEPVEAMRR